MLLGTSLTVLCSLRGRSRTVGFVDGTGLCGSDAGASVLPGVAASCVVCPVRCEAMLAGGCFCSFVLRMSNAGLVCWCRDGSDVEGVEGVCAGVDACAGVESCAGVDACACVDACAGAAVCVCVYTPRNRVKMDTRGTQFLKIATSM